MEAKEAFYAGHAGTTRAEVAAACCALPAAVLLRKGLGRPASRRLDVLALVGPALLALLEVLPLPAVLGACAAAGAAAVARGSPSPGGGAAGPPPRHRGFVTEFRGGLLLWTALCILAVDFRSFPRRFAKAETFGLGLMDVGVGGFVVSNAVVEKPGPGGRRAGRALPLLALWAGRLASLRAVDYHEHVGEYGVHWNFFATLAVVQLLAAAVPAALAGPAPRAALGLTVVAAHQAALSRGLSGFVMSADRDGRSLVALNKEGLCSLPGYWGLHLLGHAGGAALGLRGGKPWGPADRRRAAARLGGAGLALWGLSAALEARVEPISRRSANAAYVCFTLAYCALTLALLAAVELATGALRPVATLAAFNRNGLAAFLTCNLLTGLVNLTVDTLAVGPAAAFAVMLGYALLACALVLGLQDRNIVTRRW